MYIWVDLRHLFVPERSDYKSLSLASKDVAKHREREAQIADTCMKHGVFIAPGSVYMPEEYGWFRVTFTVPRNALEEGLLRFSAAVDEVEAETTCR